LDTDGNVFGGFTPVKWELNCSYKGDDSLRSFLFMLKNPHGVPPRKFALRKEMESGAIMCNSAMCAVFGADIVVKDNSNTNSMSFTQIGTHWNDCMYANDVDFEDFFTGADEFTVKEIEVFEIAN
jgi:hypothetical protein